MDRDVDGATRESARKPVSKGRRKTRKTSGSGLEALVWAEIRRHFEGTAAVADRVLGLLLFMATEELGNALGVGQSSIRNWLADVSATPRVQTTRAIDDLRTAVLIAGDAGVDPLEIGAWLTSRVTEVPGNPRPVDLARSDPGRMLELAHALAATSTPRPEGDALEPENESATKRTNGRRQLAVVGNEVS